MRKDFIFFSFGKEGGPHFPSPWRQGGPCTREKGGALTPRRAPAALPGHKAWERGGEKKGGKLSPFREGGERKKKEGPTYLVVRIGKRSPQRKREELSISPGKRRPIR